ncbi:hypothetical protein [Actinophytocola oryzae]|uniref:Uncharacterized protein n=1 Tax=Actinophytocola oryzae TaxID=502181 RepID=A0A4R7UYC9_9PSEU|nr:hypothetical protein [Actinophytocola oryzae]TDV41879.1 hypothetical protein CLV71_119201 [Actinophytocola oryzae]
MTDTTTTDVKPGDDTKPCTVCRSNDHTTSGHFDGGSPVKTDGHFDGGAMPAGHFDGGSAPV